jgi:phosphoribosylformylglycinamidine (FGAM) synthase PurS component
MLFYVSVEVKNVAGTQSPDSLMKLDDVVKRGWAVPLNNFESSKMIHFQLEAISEQEARKQVEEMCEQFLVNGVYQFANIELSAIS